MLATELHRFTVDEFRAMAEAGALASDARVELIDGLIIDMSPIGAEHSYLVDVVARLYRRRWPDDAGDAPFVRTQQPLEIGSHGQYVPDVALVLGPMERYQDHIPHADEVLEVVEIADSSLARDVAGKLAGYLAAAVPTIVVIDVQGRQVHRWTASASEPAGADHTIAVGQTEWFPGVTVDDLFA